MNRVDWQSKIRMTNRTVAVADSVWTKLADYNRYRVHIFLLNLTPSTELSTGAYTAMRFGDPPTLPGLYGGYISYFSTAVFNWSDHGMLVTESLWAFAFPALGVYPHYVQVIEQFVDDDEPTCRGIARNTSPYPARPDSDREPPEDLRDEYDRSKIRMDDFNRGLPVVDFPFPPLYTGVPARE